MTARIFAESRFIAFLTPLARMTIITVTCKRVSPSGKAAASQAAIRGFESHHPLIFT